MELALSLGDTSKPFKFLAKSPNLSTKDLSFCMALGGGTDDDDHDNRVSSPPSDPPLQLDLLPFSPVPRRPNPSKTHFPWLTENVTVVSEPGSNDGSGRGLEGEDGAALSSPNSAATSPFRMEFGMRSGGGRGNKRDLEVVETERAGSRASDDEENGTRKKLRLSKEQSAFLEESFKEHNTLNPKQKLALAKQLNLRPRQVEVWFQNRRARTKLKQTEVDCEYLKRCCETLTEENRRLQKELQELRALKTSQPFYMQLPATTLTMCPSCERVATTSTPNSSSSAAAATTTPAANPTTPTATASTTLTLAKPRLYPFSQGQTQAHQAAS